MNRLKFNDEDVKPLTNGESNNLRALETIIHDGLQQFLKVGSALMTIRDNRLYRETHTTFENYCRERWNFGRTKAHRLIDAAAVVELLPIGNMLPTNESQVRPLSALPESQRAAAWNEAVEASNGKPTAAVVQMVVNRRMVKVPIVDPEIESYVPRASQDEDWALISQIRRYGCHFPLKVWKGRNILVDGHRRLRICLQFGIPFEVEELEFADVDAVLLWILKNLEMESLGRGSETDTSTWKAEIKARLNKYELKRATTSVCTCGKLQSEHGTEIVVVDGRQHEYQFHGPATGCDQFTWAGFVPDASEVATAEAGNTREVLE